MTIMSGSRGPLRPRASEERQEPLHPLLRSRQRQSPHMARGPAAAVGRGYRLFGAKELRAASG